MGLIDKNLLVAYLNAIKPCKACSAYGEGAIDVIQHIFGYLDEMPEVDAEMVKHGRWNYSHEDDWCYCSVCGTDAEGSDGECLETDYCPHCGAKMDGGDQDG